jgi:hypothetical protein
LLCTKHNIKGLDSHHSTAVSTWSLNIFFCLTLCLEVRTGKVQPADNHIFHFFCFSLQVYLIWNYVLDGYISYIVLQNNKKFLWSICISYDMYILARPRLSGRRVVFFNKNRCFCIHLMCILSFIYICYLFICACF